MLIPDAGIVADRGILGAVYSFPASFSVRLLHVIRWVERFVVLSFEL